MKKLNHSIGSRAKMGIVKTKNIRVESRVGLDIDITVRRPDGSVRLEKTEEGHSFLANFIKTFYAAAMMHHAPNVDGAAMTLTDTGGTARAGNTGTCETVWGQPTLMSCNALVADSTYGVLVGTDTGAVYPKDIANYKLGTQIAHGTGAGQLSHSNHSIVGSSVTATDSIAGITRTFANVSGGSITVNEIGLATKMYWDMAYRYFMIIRDLLAAPVVVAHGESLTISYRIKCTITTNVGGFIRQFVSLMARQWAQVADICKDTAGQIITLGPGYFSFRMASTGGYGRQFQYSSSSLENKGEADNMGIVIGTDGSVVSPAHYNMIAQIRSGEIAGTMMYYGTAVYGCEINVGADTAFFLVEAMFKNVSGGTITVNEVGLVCQGLIPNDSYPNANLYCIARNKVAATAVADDETLRVTYTISIAT